LHEAVFLVKADLWQAAVVAFLILMLDYTAEKALMMVQKHPVARPECLQHDGGWWYNLALKQYVFTQSAFGIVDLDGFLVWGFPKFDNEIPQHHAALICLSFGYFGCSGFFVLTKCKKRKLSSPRIKDLRPKLSKW
jgi:hypothetical protein